MNTKQIFIWAVPIIMVTALGDVYLLGNMSYKEYLFQCAWEYTLLWTGFWLGEKMTIRKFAEP